MEEENKSDINIDDNIIENNNIELDNEEDDLEDDVNEIYENNIQSEEEDHNNKNIKEQSNNNVNDLNIDTNEENVKKEKNLMTKFPLAKIKNIIKMNPDIKLCVKTVYPILGKAVELLFEDLSIEAEKITKYNKRRKLNPEDLCKFMVFFIQI